MERKLLQVGNVTEERGAIKTGQILLINLPTGIPVHLSIIIASGREDGPTGLITGNIHGDEVNPVIIIHRFMNSLDLTQLKGRLVIFPSLNPTGHLIESRFPLFEPGKDPNRCWPECNPYAEQPKKDPRDLWDTIQRETSDEPGPQERCFEKIANVFKEIRPDFHLDLHTFSTLSMPFIFLDRVLYNGESELASAQVLWNRTIDLVENIGLTILMERPPWLYVKKKLHRSTSGWTLNALRIPSCTIELGAMHVSVPSARDAGITALWNTLVWSKMVDRPYEPITQCPVIKFQQPHRYLVYPIANSTGIVDYIVDVGNPFKKGDLLAIIRNIDGSVLSRVIAEMDGYIIAWNQGIAKYEKNNLGMVAVPDGDIPTVLDWKEVKS